MFVEERGQGSPVLLLHSSGMSSRQWRSLADRLADAPGTGAGFRTIAPDFLGSGANPRWPDREPFHFDLDVREIAHLAHDLGEPVHLVGHSYGGLVALTLARLHPSLVRSLSLYEPVAFGVLYDPGSSPPGVASTSSGTLPEAEALADLARSTLDLGSDRGAGGDATWLEAFIDYWNGGGTWAALPEATRKGFLAVGRKVYLEVSSLLADRTRAAAYKHVETKTLILSGERSPIAARRVAEILASALPNARLDVVSGAGHMGPITHGARVNDAILRNITGA